MKVTCTKTASIVSGLAMALMTSFAHTATTANCKSTVNVSSGARTTTIVELFTSEGCDSCPPADKWFSRLSAQKNGVVPLAYHVDYWDYIGWKDRFAKAEYAQRQRSEVRRQGGNTVYTPQVLLDGQDARQWSAQARFDSTLSAIAARTPRARIAVQANPTDAVLDISLSIGVDSTDRADADAYIVITENNLLSRVTAGENRGVTLAHDHVVRELLGPVAIDTRMDRNTDFKRAITLPTGWRREELTVAAFVQHRRTGEILQAVSAPICR